MRMLPAASTSTSIRSISPAAAWQRRGRTHTPAGTSRPSGRVVTIPPKPVSTRAASPFRLLMLVPGSMRVPCRTPRIRSIRAPFPMLTPGPICVPSSIHTPASMVAPLSIAAWRPTCAVGWTSAVSEIRPRGGV